MPRVMTGRDPGEEHRASTPLELLFDLCFVVGVSRAASLLHHGLATDHVRHAVAGFLVVFFAIWWAWLNFTWFASAYDTDDAWYRIMTFVQIVGVLILATGVGEAFDGHFGVVVTGYVVMRVALTLQWLRAARDDATRRRTALRYVLVLVVIQIGWVVGTTALPRSWGYWTFLTLVALELAGPSWAEGSADTMTQWHPVHIAERYGLFTIIVLGECVLSSFLAIDAARTSGGTTARLVIVAATGIVIMLGLWWSYFRLSAEDMLTKRTPLVFLWGYGHYVLFASIAALGAGIATIAGSGGGGGEHGEEELALSTLGRALVIAVPVAIALAVLALMRPLLEGNHCAKDGLAYGSAALVLCAGAAAPAIGLDAALIAIAVIVVLRVIVDERNVGVSRPPAWAPAE